MDFSEQLALLQVELNRFQLQYEQRHADLGARVTRLEECVSSLATREDLQKLKTELITELKPSLIDIDWLKKAFWAGVGAGTSIGVGFIAHLFGKL